MRPRCALRQPSERSVVAWMPCAIFASVVEHVDHRQVVPLADFEVVEVVRRRDLDRAGALSGSEYSSATIGMRRPTSGRMTMALPMRRRIALVIRMHGDGGVAEHGFRPRRRDDDDSRAS
jgi:hypothetical protein